jgi:hypothetical protein
LPTHRRRILTGHVTSRDHSALNSHNRGPTTRVQISWTTSRGPVTDRRQALLRSLSCSTSSQDS